MRCILDQLVVPVAFVAHSNFPPSLFWLCQPILPCSKNGMQLRLREFNSEPEEKRPSTEALASVNAMYTNLRRLPVFRLLSLGVEISDYNEIMELPLLSLRECTPSLEVLELLSPRRTPSPQSIPNMMKTFFMEWDDFIAESLGVVITKKDTVATVNS